MFGARVAFDPDGNPAVLYDLHCSTGHSLHLARWTGATWVRELVPVDYDGGQLGQSFAFDRVTGEVVIAASITKANGSNPLILYRQIAGSWQGAQVDSWTSDAVVAYGSNGPVLAYRVSPRRQPTILRIAEWTGSGWSKHDLPPELSGKARSSIDLALDAFGHPAVLYRLDVGGDGDALGFALWDGSAWHQEIVSPSTGFVYWLAWDPVGEEFVATHYTEGEGTGNEVYRISLFRRIAGSGGVWEEEPVTAERWAYPTSLDYDGAGTALITYATGAATLALTTRGAGDPAWSPREILHCEAGHGVAAAVNALTGELAVAIERRDPETDRHTLMIARRQP